MACEVLHIPQACQALSNADIKSLETFAKAAAAEKAQTSGGRHDVAVIKLTEGTIKSWPKRIPWFAELGSEQGVDAEHVYQRLHEQPCAVGDLIVVVKRPSVLAVSACHVAYCEGNKTDPRLP